MNWHLKTFDELHHKELYEILRVRSEVFVVEQNCVFLDMDNVDQLCHHCFLMTDDNQLVAYTRIVPPGISYAECSIGRVITSPRFRGLQYGIQVMERSIAYCAHLYGQVAIKIGAQLYLKHFYESFGFQQCGIQYDEDGIIHIPMLLSK
jgi:ElaA protein